MSSYRKVYGMYDGEAVWYIVSEEGPFITGRDVIDSGANLTFRGITQELHSDCYGYIMFEDNPIMIDGEMVNVGALMADKLCDMLTMLEELAIDIKSL